MSRGGREGGRRRERTEKKWFDRDNQCRVPTRLFSFSSCVRELSTDCIIAFTVVWTGIQTNVEATKNAVVVVLKVLTDPTQFHTTMLIERRGRAFACALVIVCIKTESDFHSITSVRILLGDIKLPVNTTTGEIIIFTNLLVVTICGGVLFHDELPVDEVRCKPPATCDSLVSPPPNHLPVSKMMRVGNGQKAAKNITPPPMAAVPCVFPLPKRPAGGNLAVPQVWSKQRTRDRCVDMYSSSIRGRPIDFRKAKT